MPVCACWRIVVKDYLKPLAYVCPRFQRYLGSKKVGSCPFRDDQLRVKAPGLIDSKQTVPDLAFLQERPADELAQPSLQTWPGRGRYTKANLVEATISSSEAKFPLLNPYSC